MKTKRYGFSLIELMVVTGLTAMIGVITTMMFVSILNGSRRTDRTTEIKQNGELTLANMERVIRGAGAITSQCMGVPTDTLSLTDIRGNAVTYGCEQNAGVLKIASQSAQTIYLTSDTVTLGNDICPGTLQFTCIQPPNSPPVVSIQFTLSDIHASDKLPLSETFSTSITLRNK